MRIGTSGPGVKKSLRGSWPTWARLYFRENPFKCVTATFTLIGVAQLVAYSIWIGFLQEIDLKSVPTYIFAVAVLGVVTAASISVLVLGPGAWTEVPRPIRVLCQSRFGGLRVLFIPQSPPGRCFLFGTYFSGLMMSWFGELLMTVVLVLLGSLSFLAAESLLRRRVMDRGSDSKIAIIRIEATWHEQFKWVVSTIAYALIGACQVFIVLLMVLSIERDAIAYLWLFVWLLAAMSLSLATYVARAAGTSMLPTLGLTSAIALALTIGMPHVFTRGSLNLLGLGGMERASLRVTDDACRLINSFGPSKVECHWDAQLAVGKVDDVEVLLAMGTTYLIGLPSDPLPGVKGQKRDGNSGNPSKLSVRIPADKVLSIASRRALR